jgi:hypothetical protein
MNKIHNLSMKLTPSLSLLIMAAGWLCMAQSDVLLALRCTGDDRTQYLKHARDDAARFRFYTSIWWRAIQAPELAA